MTQYYNGPLDTQFGLFPFNYFYHYRGCEREEPTPEIVENEVIAPDNITWSSRLYGINGSLDSSRLALDFHPGSETVFIKRDEDFAKTIIAYHQAFIERLLISRATDSSVAATMIENGLSRYWSNGFNCAFEVTTPYECRCLNEEGRIDGPVVGNDFFYSSLDALKAFLVAQTEAKTEPMFPYTPFHGEMPKNGFCRWSYYLPYILAFDNSGTTCNWVDTANMFAKDRVCGLTPEAASFLVCVARNLCSLVSGFSIETRRAFNLYSDIGGYFSNRVYYSNNVHPENPIYGQFDDYCSYGRKISFHDCAETDPEGRYKVDIYGTRTNGRKSEIWNIGLGMRILGSFGQNIFQAPYPFKRANIKMVKRVVTATVSPDFGGEGGFTASGWYNEHCYTYNSCWAEYGNAVRYSPTIVLERSWFKGFSLSSSITDSYDSAGVTCFQFDISNIKDCDIAYLDCSRSKKEDTVWSICAWAPKSAEELVPDDFDDDNNRIQYPANAILSGSYSSFICQMGGVAILQRYVEGWPFGGRGSDNVSFGSFFKMDPNFGTKNYCATNKLKNCAGGYLASELDANFRDIVDPTNGKKINCESVKRLSEIPLGNVSFDKLKSVIRDPFDVAAIWSDSSKWLGSKTEWDRFVARKVYDSATDVCAWRVVCAHRVGVGEEPSFWECAHYVLSARTSIDGNPWFFPYRGEHGECVYDLCLPLIGMYSMSTNGNVVRCTPCYYSIRGKYEPYDMSAHYKYRIARIFGIVRWKYTQIRTEKGDQNAN